MWTGLYKFVSVFSMYEFSCGDRLGNRRQVFSTLNQRFNCNSISLLNLNVKTSASALEILESKLRPYDCYAVEVHAQSTVRHLVDFRDSLSRLKDVTTTRKHLVLY